MPSVRDVSDLDDVIVPLRWLSGASSRAKSKSEEPPTTFPTVDEADPAVVLFTSGSRGTPKGVIHSHGSATRSIAAGLDARRVGADDRLYLPMPLFWTGGFSSGLFTMLVTGCTLLTEAEPEPTRTLELLERERATLFRGWPDQAARLAAHPERDRFDLSSLRDASLPHLLPPERRPAPGARSNLLGMTESFGPYCADRMDRDLPADKHGSCGRPFPGVEVRATDPETGEPCASDVEGELWLRGPTILRGICGRDPSDVFTSDGWFRTGDLGRIDAEGYLWFAGRLDDMFKVSGASVYPSEVEKALRSIDGVREAHVTNVAGAAGPSVGALVVGEVDLAAVHAEARARLSAFKVPSVWVLSTDPAVVPVGGTGKLVVADLRTLLAAEGVPSPTTRSTEHHTEETPAR